MEETHSTSGESMQQKKKKWTNYLSNHKSSIYGEDHNFAAGRGWLRQKLLPTKKNMISSICLQAPTETLEKIIHVSTTKGLLYKDCILHARNTRNALWIFTSEGAGAMEIKVKSPINNDYCNLSSVWGNAACRFSAQNAKKTQILFKNLFAC